MREKLVILFKVKRAFGKRVLLLQPPHDLQNLFFGEHFYHLRVILAYVYVLTCCKFYYRRQPCTNLSRMI